MDIQTVEQFILSKGLLTADPAFPMGVSVEEFVKPLTTRTFPETSGNEECDKGKRRSIGDLYRTLHTYNPNIPLSELLVELKKNIRAGLITSIICPDIKKRVYDKHWDFSDLRWGRVNTDEFRLDHSDMDDVPRTERSIYQLKDEYNIKFEL